MIADILLKRSPNFFLGYFWKHHYWNKNWSGYFLGNFWYNWATFYSCIWSHRPPTITVHLIELFSVWPWWKVSRLWRSADSKYDVAKIFNLVRRRLICIFISIFGVISHTFCAPMTSHYIDRLNARPGCLVYWSSLSIDSAHGPL